MHKRKLMSFFLMPIGIIGVLVVSLVVLFSYTPDTSAPFPYIPPPVGDLGYYTGTTVNDMQTFFLGAYANPKREIEKLKGENFIFKNIVINADRVVIKRIEIYDAGGKLVGRETEAYIKVGAIQFVPQDPSDLEKLRVGDTVDIIGVLVGISKEWPSIIVVRNCQFFSAGVLPLPLPGGPAIIDGY